MDYFAVDGRWWLPGCPEQQPPGTLSLDSDGLTLVVHGSLVPTVATPGEVLVQKGPPDWTITPFILGRTHDGRKVTLLDAGGANLIDVGSAIYSARMALIGSHITTDRFTEAWCDFDCLNAWANPPPLTSPAQETNMLDLRFENVDLADAVVREARIRLVAAVEGTVGGHAVRAEQRAVFVLSIPPTASHFVLKEWVRPLQDLLILAIGRPVRLTRLYLRPDSADLRNGLLEASTELVQPAPGPSPTWSGIRSYGAPTLLTLADSPLPFAALLPRWFDLWSELREVFVLLHGPYYAPFMFSEHRYSSIFQGAEALARARGLAGREKTKSDHRMRVADIVWAAREAAVDEDIVQWAQRVLQSRNDKPLWQQIQDLVESVGEIGARVLEASPAFGKIAAAGRTGVSHPRASSDIDAVDFLSFGEVLRWIVRARVLMDLGVSIQEIERRVLGRALFQHALEEIRKGQASRPGRQQEI